MPALSLFETPTLRVLQLLDARGERVAQALHVELGVDLGAALPEAGGERARRLLPAALRKGRLHAHAQPGDGGLVGSEMCIRDRFTFLEL